MVQTNEQAEMCRRRFAREPVLIKSATEAAAPQAGAPDAFLWVGRMEAYKRPHEFLALAEALPEVRFRLVATPGHLDDSSLKERAARIPNLEWMGPRPRAELLGLMDSAVALVSTSEVEGMPNVFLEAWARGVPTLALDVDPDGLIESEGLGIWAKGDRAELAERTAELWSDRAVREAISRRYRLRSPRARHRAGAGSAGGDAAAGGLGVAGDGDAEAVLPNRCRCRTA